MKIRRIFFYIQFFFISGVLFSKDIIIGTSIPLAAEGKEILTGLRLATKKFNDSGGINGQKMVITALDDEKSIGTSVNNVKKLLSKTKIITNIFTNGVVEELLSGTDKFLYFAPEENSTFLKKTEHIGIINLKAPLSDELKVMIDYTIEHRKKYTFVIFYEDSTWGKSGQLAAEKIIKEHSKINQNIKMFTSFSYPRGTVDIDTAARNIISLAPEAIICISRRHATYNFILQCVNGGLFRTVYLAPSYLLPIQEMVEKSRGVEFIVTSVSPDPKHSNLKIMNDYRQAMQTNNQNQDFSTISFSGYFSGLVLGRLMEKILGDITFEKIITVAENLHNEDLDGLKLNFDPSTQTLFHSIWISPSYKSQWILIDRK